MTGPGEPADGADAVAAELAATARALEDPGEYIREWADRPGFNDRESRIAAARVALAEVEAHKINDEMRRARPAAEE